MEYIWDQVIAEHPAGNILQTSLWGRLKADFGWSWEIVTCDASNPAVGGALVLDKSLPMRLGRIAYIPRGPLVDWEDTHAIETMLSVIESTARLRKAWAIWMEPEMLRGSDIGKVVGEYGYRSSQRTIQPSSTIVVDISDDEDKILARMKSKTRYYIRLAQRKGVQVREGGLGDLETFYALMQVTSERDKFGIHSKLYYQRLLELFLPAGQVGLVFADVEDEPTAALLILALGTKAWYIAGASSNKHRKLMPTYAAQWAAIRWAKARGCKSYDLWGVPDADEDTLEAQFPDRSDGLWGVYRFKRGFGGDLVRYTGLWEKPLHPLYRLGTKLYNVISV